MPSKVSRFNDEDPLTKAIAPPPDETIPQREARLIAEQNAKRVSDAIDEELNRQRLANKKATKPIKILLLGQLHSFLLTFHSPSPLPPRSERIRYFFFPLVFQLYSCHHQGKSTTLKSTCIPCPLSLSYLPNSLSDFQLMNSPKVRFALFTPHVIITELAKNRHFSQRNRHGGQSYNSTSSALSVSSSTSCPRPNI